MPLFLVNLVLALAWSAIMGTFTPMTLIAGFILGYGVLWLARPALGPSAYYKGLWRGIAFAGFYLWELVVSSVRVAVDVLTPHHRMRPGVVAVPLRAKTDFEITALANLVTLTPGTLSLDVCDNRTTLYVHAMYLDEGPDSVREEVRHLEDRVLRIVRTRRGGGETADLVATDL
ncbi:MAG: Na+/H+ antiporter subunit E [Bacteroidota bacterium]